MTNKQFNIRNLPEHTAQQIDELCAKMGMTKTQLVLLAIERLYQQETKSPQKQAKSE
jgi:predicted DNA-binding protein